MHLLKCIIVLFYADECLVDGICPAGSRCINTIGSYSCACDVGYFVMNIDGGGNTCNGSKIKMILIVKDYHIFLS